MIKYVNGDLIKMAKNMDFDLIAHGCNCQHNFEKGIAKKIKKEFPDSFDADLSHLNPQLGGISIGYEMEYELCIVNCYTQIWYGQAYSLNNRNKIKADTVEARYNAIRSCFQQINIEYEGDHLGLPLIGCGLAGLEWKNVKNIINEELTDLNVTIVEFDK